MIDIVYVNWNSGSDLQNSCNSLINLNSDLIRNIIVVDNCSSDFSADFIKANKNIKLIESPQNIGFARGCNLGAKYSTSDFILFLNPDTLVTNDIFSSCLEVFSSEKNIGIVGVKILDNNNVIAKCCSRFPTFTHFLFQCFALDKVFPILGSRMADWNHNDSRIVDQVIGAFFLMPRSLFFDLNGFDENFFMYYEEVDLSYRARKFGYSSYYLSSVFIKHEGGGASKKVKSNRLFYSLRSRLQYSRKHFSLIKYFATIFITLFIEPLTRLTHSIIFFNFNDFKEILSAFAKLYRYIYYKLSEKA